jgi:3-oxoacyl-[acyl-carrier protein] reductase
MMSPTRTPPFAVGETLKDAIVILTGVGLPGQVGEVVARTFAQRGSHVILVDRKEDAVRERAAALTADGHVAHAFACDLTDRKQVEHLAAQVGEIAPDGLQAFVHLAGGYAEGGPVADLDPDTWHRLFAINLTTAFLTSRALISLLRKRRGALLFFGSAAALPGASVKNSSAYAAAKGGVITLMRAIAAEEQGNGVRANALAPQAIRTVENEQSMGKDHRYVERQTIADWAWWLCGEGAGPVTGQVIRLG